MDGEKSPLIISPRVMDAATSRVVIDLWRSCLDGTVIEFSPPGFRVEVRDPFGSMHVTASVDAHASTFVLDGNTLPPRPLSEFWNDLRTRADQERREWHAQYAPAATPPAESLLQRIRRWLN